MHKGKFLSFSNYQSDFRNGFAVHIIFKTHFHKRGFTRSLVLKVRVFGICQQLILMSSFSSFTALFLFFTRLLKLDGEISEKVTISRKFKEKVVQPILKVSEEQLTTVHFSVCVSVAPSQVILGDTVKITYVGGYIRTVFSSFLFLSLFIVWY